MSVFRELRGALHPGFALANTLPTLFPAAIAGRLRPRLLRWFAGVTVGEDAFLPGRLQVNTAPDLGRNLRIGKRCYVNTPVFFDLNALITLGDDVYVGHHVTIVTSNHEIGDCKRRAGRLIALPVTIGDGAWIAAGAILLPGVTVGPGAIVAAGAVVTRDVPMNTLVGGVPSRVIREL